MAEPSEPRKLVKVLCTIDCRSSALNNYEQKTILIAVESSRDIMTALKYRVPRETMPYGRQSIADWRLRSYWPENGLERF